MTYEEAKKDITAYVYAEYENIPAQAVQALNIMREALEKQIPRKPIELTNVYPDGQFSCPFCGDCRVGYPIFRNTPFGEMRSGEHKAKYCENCGQAIDWSV
jgi:hypothetical protein